MRSSTSRRAVALLLSLLSGIAIAASDASPPAPALASDPDVAEATRCIPLASSSAQTAVDMARDLLSKAGISAVARVRANICLGMAQSHVGNADAARAAALAAVSLLENDTTLDETERIRGYGVASEILTTIGDIQQAITLFERFYELGKRDNSPALRIRVLMQRAQLASDFLDDLPGAEQFVRQALELAIASNKDDGYVYYTYGMLLIRLKRYDEAMPMLDRALASLDKVPPQAQALLHARIQTHRAQALLARGETAAARQLLDTSLAAQHQLPDVLGESVTLTTLARVRLASGDTGGAIDSARQAEAIAERGGYRIERQQALQVLADALLAGGKAGEALATVRRAFALEAKNLRTQNLQSIAGLQASLAHQAERHRNERIDLERDLAIGILLLIIVFGAGIAAFLHRANRSLRIVSNTEPLTGLLNRRAAGRKLAALAAPGGSPGVVMLLDIDHFKTINDEYGHEQGDEVLKAVAHRLRTACAGGDVLARWGGEEFLLVRPHADVAQAQVLAEQLRAAIGNEPISLGGGTTTVTASIGFAAWPFFPDPDGNPWQESLKLADHALYAAKRAGRDGWVGLWGTPAGVGTPMAALWRSLERAQARGLLAMHASRRATLAKAKNEADDTPIDMLQLQS